MRVCNFLYINLDARVRFIIKSECVNLDDLHIVGKADAFERVLTDFQTIV